MCAVDLWEITVLEHALIQTPAHFPSRFGGGRFKKKKNKGKKKKRKGKKVRSIKQQ